jgi:hypothetical protein
MNQVEVVAVQFTKVGKPYYYLTKDLAIHADDFVVIETQRGLEMAMVQGEPKLIEATKPKGNSNQSCVWQQKKTLILI